MRILVDATETWDLATALETGFALQEAGIHWLEDPIATENVAGLARLCGQLRVRIATGEHIYNVSDFRRLFEEHATGIALIDLGRIGGITPWRRVAALAQAYTTGAATCCPKCTSISLQPFPTATDRKRRAARGNTEGHARRGERLPRNSRPPGLGLS